MVAVVIFIGMFFVSSLFSWFSFVLCWFLILFLLAGVILRVDFFIHSFAYVFGDTIQMVLFLHSFFLFCFFLSYDFFPLYIGVLRTVCINFYPQRAHSNIILHATIATVWYPHRIYRSTLHTHSKINQQWHEGFGSNEIRWKRRRRKKIGDRMS